MYTRNISDQLDVFTFFEEPLTFWSTGMAGDSETVVIVITTSDFDEQMCAVNVLHN